MIKIDLTEFYAMVHETRGEELEAVDRLESHVVGSLRQRDRIVWAARWSLEHFRGDIIEIGCLHGGTTKLLAPLAREFGRKVLCVDPWVHEPYYGPREPNEVFMEVMEPWLDVIDIIRDESQKDEVVSAIQARELAFAFVDGLHTYPVCLQDIISVKHTAGFIAVDDTLWSSEVSSAFVDGLKATRRSGEIFDYCRESWILPTGG